MRKKRSIFYYMRYKNISAEISSYHAEISLKNTMLTYLLYAVSCIVLGFFLDLKPISLLIVAALSFIFSPYIVLCTYRNEYEQKRFSDVTQYMQQMLYSFRSTGKIKIALQDTMTLFDDTSYMKKLLQKALVTLDSPDYTKDATRAAFEIIEEEYGCERLFTIHDFLEKAEKNGGEYSQTIELLLSDRTFWVDRMVLFQEDKKMKKIEVAASIIISIALCVLTRVFPMMMGTPSMMEFTSHILYQIAGVFMLVFDLIVYVLACRKLTTDWLDENEIVAEETIVKDYEYVVNYDEKLEKRKSYIWLVVPATLLIIGFFTKQIAFYVIGAALVPVMLFQHKLNYHLCMKELREEIQLKFPRWMMEVTLLLQSMNVQKAILSTIETAPIVLVPELNKFKEAIAEDPTSANPYLEFMKPFKVPEVTSSMNMLYSLSQGQGMEADVDSQRQIREIIGRNNKLLDQAEKEANENKMLSFALYFSLPQIPACIMLVVVLLLTMMVSVADLSALF